MLNTLRKQIFENLDDIHGFLTKEEVLKLKQIPMKNQSPYRKRTYSTWTCNECNHTCFYKTLRCQMCSATLTEKVNNTLYMNGIEAREAILHDQEV